MKKVFCHNLKIIFTDYDGIVKEETKHNIIVGVEYSNMGSFAVIEWTLEEFLINHSKKDIDYCIGRGTIDSSGQNSVWYEQHIF